MLLNTYIASGNIVTENQRFLSLTDIMQSETVGEPISTKYQFLHNVACVRNYKEAIVTIKDVKICLRRAAEKRFIQGYLCGSHTCLHHSAV